MIFYKRERRLRERKTGRGSENEIERVGDKDTEKEREERET